VLPQSKRQHMPQAANIPPPQQHMQQAIMLHMAGSSCSRLLPMALSTQKQQQQQHQHQQQQQ
jgi:hypothetical protein